MKLVTFLLTTIFLMGCATSHQDSTQTRLASNAKREQDDAERLGKEYLMCIDHILGSTSVETYATPKTRHEVVLASCHDDLEPFTIVQEQAYNNACAATGKDSKTCDSDAVNKAAHDTDELQQKARKLIDHAPLRSSQPPLWQVGAPSS